MERPLLLVVNAYRRAVNMPNREHLKQTKEFVAKHKAFLKEVANLEDGSQTSLPPQDKSLDDALLLGLANHSNEFLNPWFFRQSISHEELAYALDHILNHSRLKERLLQWHKQSLGHKQSLARQQAALIQRIREEVIDKAQTIYLTKAMVEADDYGDDIAKHWDMLKAKQNEALTKLERELDE